MTEKNKHDLRSVGPMRGGGLVRALTSAFLEDQGAAGPLYASLVSEKDIFVSKEAALSLMKTDLALQELHLL